MSCLLLLLLLISPSQASSPIAEALAKPVLKPGQTLEEVRQFVEALIPSMPTVTSTAEWKDRAKGYRASVLKSVVFRGEAAKWRDLPTKAEYLGEIPGGPGYRIRKLRFQVVPGLWIPALLYKPTELRGQVPVVLNVNGHDADGKAADYKQIRCINQAKRGMLALNLEWFGMGQLKQPGFEHGLINAIDLTGTSGIALHYLAMKRGIDILLSQPNADPTRVGVTGLSGGGWQTIFISGLDDRVTLTDPVAGYSSFRTRARVPSDLGDSEQTSCDLATIVDYTHLTAMMAPNPTLLTFNAKDNCCFAAPHALPPLREAAAPIFALFGVPGNLRAHMNIDPGTHNYLLDNRQALYQMMADHWSRPGYTINPKEIPSESELKTAEELRVELPSDNLNFHSLAVKLAKDLPLSQKNDRIELRSLIRPIGGPVTAIKDAENSTGDLKTSHWRIKIGTAWSVPAIELSKGSPTSTTILIGDLGKTKQVEQAKSLIDSGQRVIAVDLYGFGENQPPDHVYLYALLVGTVGERPLGLAAGQISAVASWRKTLDGTAPKIEAVGPRTSAIALTAAALNLDGIGDLTLHQSMKSLKEIIDSSREYPASPELFCFGLLERFDLTKLQELAKPRVVQVAPR